jgi:hypothetical protein
MDNLNLLGDRQLYVFIFKDQRDHNYNSIVGNKLQQWCSERMIKMFHITTGTTINSFAMVDQNSMLYTRPFQPSKITEDGVVFLMVETEEDAVLIKTTFGGS